MPTISAVIIARNEEDKLGRCLEALKWVDEIIVIDSGSTDSTREIAWEAGAVVHDIEWRGFGPAKAYGVDQARSDWILSIDADEIVTAELAGEIQALLGGNPALEGYAVPRLTKFLGRWIKHGGWYPDYILRLFKKGRGNFDMAVVHEKVDFEGEVGRLDSALLHYCYPDLDSYLTKSNRYTTLGAEKAHSQGKKAGLFDLTVRPLVSFLSHYLVRQGFRDGREGFLISVLSSVAVMTKYAKLRAMQSEPEDTE